MHPRELIMVINLVQNEISDNFYADYKAAQSNVTELYILNLMNKFKIMISNAMAILPHSQMLEFEVPWFYKFDVPIFEENLRYFGRQIL